VDVKAQCELSFSSAVVGFFFRSLVILAITENSHYWKWEDAWLISSKITMPSHLYFSHHTHGREGH